ncbi:hypothetical protein [Amycolatopsis sp. NPDC051061]|uniref:hypothetical protein n=1 Tax=Amycolatopsis sp. NPDC051061 TaxID=3155042 RepID=UPI00342F193B
MPTRVIQICKAVAVAFLFVTVIASSSWFVHQVSKQLSRDKDNSSFSDEEPPLKLLPGPHPPRTESCKFLIDGRSAELTATGSCDVTVNRKDPLLQSIRSGSGEVSSLMAAVTAVNMYQDGLPTVDLLPSSPNAQIHVRGSLNFSIIIDDQSENLIKFSLEPREESDVNRLSNRVENRNITIETIELSVVGSQGPIPVEQGSTKIKFDGNPSVGTYILIKPEKSANKAWFPTRIGELTSRRSSNVAEFAALALIYFFPYLVVLRWTSGSHHPDNMALRNMTVAIIFGIFTLGSMIASSQLSITSIFGVSAREFSAAGAGLATFSGSLVVAAAWHTGHGSTPIPARRGWILSSVAFVILLTLFWTLNTRITAMTVGELMALVAVVAACTLIQVALVRKNNMFLGLLIGFISAVACLILFTFKNTSSTPLTWLPDILAGLGMMPLVAIGLSITNLSRRWRVLLSLTLAALAYTPLVYLIFESDDLTYWPLDYGGIISQLASSSTQAIGMSWLTVANLIICVLILAQLRKQSDLSFFDARKIRLPLIAVSIIFIPTKFLPGVPNALACTLLFIGFYLAIPARSTAIIDRTMDAHRTAFQAETRRRLSQSAAARFYHSAQGDLAAGNIDADGFLARYESLTSLDPTRSASSSSRVSSPLGSNCGETAWQNLKCGLRLALPICMPSVIFEAWAYVSSTSFEYQSVVDIIDNLRHILRWFTYAAIYGYAYPWLRGSNPIQKSIVFAIALGIPEVITALSTPTLEQNLLVSSVVRSGQVVFFCICLGMLWEREIARRANTAWSQIRDFRKLRSLAAPTITVLVAAATAAATVLATAAVTPKSTESTESSTSQDKDGKKP